MHDNDTNASIWTTLDPKGENTLRLDDTNKNDTVAPLSDNKNAYLSIDSSACYHLLRHPTNNSKHSRGLAVFIVILRLLYGMVDLTVKPFFSLCYAIDEVVINYKIRKKNYQRKLHKIQLASRVLISFFLLCAYILSILSLFYNPLSQVAVLGVMLKPTLSIANFQVPIMLILIFFISGLSDAVFCILKFTVPKNSSDTNNFLISWRKVKLFFMTVFAFFLGDQGAAIIYENYILSDVRKQDVIKTKKNVPCYLSMLRLLPQHQQTGSDQETILLCKRLLK